MPQNAYFREYAFNAMIRTAPHRLGAITWGWRKPEILSRNATLIHDREPFEPDPASTGVGIGISIEWTAG